MNIHDYDGPMSRVMELCRFLAEDPSWTNEPPSLDIAVYTVEFLCDLYEAGVDAPHVFPSIDGGYSLEWGETDVRILNDGRVEIFCMDPVPLRHSNQLTEYISQDFAQAPPNEDLVRWIKQLLDYNA